MVVRRAGTLPVYTVKPENGDGPLRNTTQGPVASVWVPTHGEKQ